MAVRYTAHARQQMQRRQITEEQVELVLQRPAGVPNPGNRHDTLVLSSPLGGRNLKVVVDSIDTELVVTVFWEGSGR